MVMHTWLLKSPQIRMAFVFLKLPVGRCCWNNLVERWTEFDHIRCLECWGMALDTHRIHLNIKKTFVIFDNRFFSDFTFDFRLACLDYFLTSKSIWLSTVAVQSPSGISGSSSWHCSVAVKGLTWPPKPGALPRGLLRCRLVPPCRWNTLVLRMERANYKRNKKKLWSNYSSLHF